MSRWHQLDTVAIGINHQLGFAQALSRDDQFAVAARCCLRQRLRVMVELDDGALLVVPVLLLSALNRQHMIEANNDIPLPEPQHWL
jgi:hypothetical protein